MTDSNRSISFANDARSARDGSRSHHTIPTQAVTRRPTVSFDHAPARPPGIGIPQLSSRHPTGIQSPMPFVTTGTNSSPDPTICDTLRPDRVNGVPDPTARPGGGRGSQCVHPPGASGRSAPVPVAGARSQHTILTNMEPGPPSQHTHTQLSQALIPRPPTIHPNGSPKPRIGEPRPHQPHAPRASPFWPSVQPDIVMDVPLPMSPAGARAGDIAYEGEGEGGWEEDQGACWREPFGGGGERTQGFGVGMQQPGSRGQGGGMQQLQIEGLREADEQRGTQRPSAGQRSQRGAQRPPGTQRPSVVRHADGRYTVMNPPSGTSRLVGSDPLAGQFGGPHSQRPSSGQRPSST
jgi:hypothetical protein